MFDPAPAPSCRSTWCPEWVSSRTPSGVSATRYSLSLTSAGTPTITPTSLDGGHCPPATFRNRSAGQHSHSACAGDSGVAVRPTTPGGQQETGHRLGVTNATLRRQVDRLEQGEPQYLD